MKYTNIILFCLLSLSVQGQSVRFSASTNVKQAVLGSYFQVTFTLENGDGKDFKAPRFKDFRILGGPNFGSQIVTVNGVIRRSANYSFTLSPKKVGTFKIGEASIKVKGKTYRTTPITVEVVKLEEQQTNSKTDDSVSDVFVKAIATPKEAYVGQQIALDFKLYTNVDIKNYEPNINPEFKGVYAKELDFYNGQVVREIAKGKEYSTKVIRRFAVFPQKEGKLTINAMGIVIETVAQRRRDIFDSFFSPTERKQLMTSPINLNIKPLPTPPPNFSGAIGQYELETNVNRKTLSTDESLTLQLIIRGNGDVKRINLPILDSLKEDFEIYEPRVNASTTEQNGELIGQKTIAYLIVPKKAGTYTIAPELTYYDTKIRDYVTLNPKTYSITVTRGSNVNEQGNNQNFTDDGARDIRFIKATSSFSRGKSSFFGTFAFWILWILPLLTLIGVVVYRQILIQQGKLDPILLRKQRADKVAMKHLKVAETHLQTKDNKAFYDAIAQALWGYVSDKLTIPTSELSKDNVQEKLKSLKVSEANIQQFLQIIQTCQMALFAGMNNVAAMEQTFENTRDLITNIENINGKR